MKRKTVRYRTLEEVRKSGDLSRGWLPTFMPQSATETVETHNVESNEVWGSFRFSTADVTPPGRALTSIDVTGHTVRRDWDLRGWPLFFQGELSVDSVARAGYQTYKTEKKRPVFLALNWEQGKAYFWKYSS